MFEVVKTLVTRNKTYAVDHVPRPPLPTMNTIVICCLDARIDPASFLGLELGEALVVRNAGGRFTKAVEQELAVIIAMVSKALGRPLRPNIVVVHHTDCGVENLANPELAASLSQACSVDASFVAAMAISDHETSLRTDLANISASVHLPAGLPVSGVIYDQGTGAATVLFDVVTP